MIDLDAIKARLAAVHAAGISVIHTRLADHGIRVLVSMRDWSGNNRYDADTAVTTLIGNAPADIGALVDEVERLRGHRESCTENLLKGYETGKAEERAAVVAWLQAEAKRMYEAGQDRPAWFILERKADIIERGEHRRKEEG